MKCVTDDIVNVKVNKKGSEVYKKVSYPLRVGLYSEIETREYIYQYDLNGEIKYIQGKIGWPRPLDNWPHPLEWLKRTKTNRWVYYFSGEYNDLFDAIGEYYLPCFQYQTNTLWKRNPFKDKEVKRALEYWKNFYEKLSKIDIDGFEKDVRDFLKKVRRANPSYLEKRAKELYSIIGTKINVLPPDTRHVDYECIPLIISDGCIYRCKFCMVKSNKKFKERNWQDVKSQIKRLKDFYSEDIINYNAIFVGENDALNSSFNFLFDSVMTAYKEFDFENSYVKGNYLFIFGSVKSFMKLKDEELKSLNVSPFYTYINIGLESPDPATLKIIGKPLSESEVKECFLRALEVNKKFLNIEITVNFLFDFSFPDSHLSSIERLLQDLVDRPYSKGCVYFSPLDIPKSPKEMLRFFKNFKRKSKLPMYLYIIQKF